MSRVSDVVTNFQEGFACSQAIFVEYCELFDLDRDQAIKIAAGFAGGMRQASTCGSVTSAYMILGLKFGSQQSTKPEGRKAIYDAISEFNRRFLEANNSLTCKGLLGCDISTAEGLEVAKEKNLFKTVCPGYLQTSVEILDEMVARD